MHVLYVNMLICANTCCVQTGVYKDYISKVRRHLAYM